MTNSDANRDQDHEQNQDQEHEYDHSYDNSMNEWDHSANHYDCNENHTDMSHNIPLPCPPEDDCKDNGDCIRIYNSNVSITNNCKTNKWGPTGPHGPHGPHGPRGCTGPTGPTGYTGPIGEQGYQGEIGPTGPTGDKGDQGEKGDKGDQGEKGDKGDQGEKGDKGDQGDKGDKGDQGDTGATGPTNYVSFMNVYAVEPQQIATEQSVAFFYVNAMVGDYAMDIGSTDIYVWRRGYYYASVVLHHKEPCQFTVMKNDVFQTDGGVFGSPTGATQTTHTFIIVIRDTDMISATTASPSGFACKLQVKNHTSFAPIIELDGVSGAGSALGEVVASFSLIYLNDVIEPPTPPI